MNRKAKFIRPIKINAFMKKENANLKLTDGFLVFLDLYMEAVLKRAAVQQHSRRYLDAPAALLACRHPYNVSEPYLNYQP